MHGLLKVLVLSLVVALGSWSAAAAGERSSFEGMLSYYETIRLALLHDRMDGVSEAARHIHKLSRELDEDLNVEAAGIRPDSAEELRALLPSIRDASRQMSAAEAIEEAREALGALSKALVQYRRLVKDPAPLVAFCPMAQKVWLQPNGEIGNPYYGQSMARCGEFVSQ